MGLSVTEYLLAKGDAVVAAVRKPESMKSYQAKYGADKLLVVKVNVQSQEDIDAAFAKAKNVFGRVDVVYNNAGSSAVGEVEAMPVEDGKDMFEVRLHSIGVLLSNHFPNRQISSAQPAYLLLLSSSSVK